MPQLVGGAVDMTWSHADMEKGYIILLNIHKTF